MGMGFGLALSLTGTRGLWAAWGLMAVWSWIRWGFAGKQEKMHGGFGLFSSSVLVELFGAAGCYYCCCWQQTKREGKEAWVFLSGFCIAGALPNSEVVEAGKLMNSENGSENSQI
ncbi:hypothetical protein KY290_036843 [Solanum tuberosum]|uniref:Uncharacterized protein n=1 Tax=Solanum tuberosum TaxID=4113 RepID=A0ABQ7TVX1_SOLTU|nr:hypothetical protein KY285_036164 [Solanum tuberosum]KAH0738138.1 hypothetical protein KY290_036843 [Solanum tuberosum]